MRNDLQTNSTILANQFDIGKFDFLKIMDLGARIRKYGAKILNFGAIIQKSGAGTVGARIPKNLILIARLVQEGRMC